MKALEKFLGYHITDLPLAKHHNTAQRVDEGPHECVLCEEEAVEAFHLAWPPPLGHSGYWVDTCAKHGSELRLSVHQEGLDRGL